MDPILHTPRLKLTLITHAERGSDELTWLHELRSNTQAMAWSIRPPSSSISDTENSAATYLPDTTTSGAEKSHRIAYAVHEIPTDADQHTRFIGLVHLVALSGSALALPPSLAVPKELEETTLVVELAYAFLPHAWGKGYATEATAAVLAHCRSERATSFWEPWEKVWMRAIVNGRNPPSQRVMRKCGVQRRGVFEWRGERIFIGGEWRTEDDLVVYGDFIRGGRGELVG